jgi:hypothetical protein
MKDVMPEAERQGELNRLVLELETVIKTERR